MNQSRYILRVACARILKYSSAKKNQNPIGLKPYRIVWVRLLSDRI